MIRTLTAFCVAVILIGMVSSMGCGGRPTVKGETKTGVADVESLPNAVEAVMDNPNDWLSWRGPNRNGVTNGQKPPVQWSETENVVWKTKLPGKGHASPTIVSDKIFLATASKSDDAQSMVCVDRLSGNVLWEKVVHSGGLSRKIHDSNSYASQTVASDGKSVFCVFVNDGKVMVTQFDLEGNQGWQKSVGKYTNDFGFGFGTPPVCWNDILFVTSESVGDAFVVALNPNDGSELYRIERAKTCSYSPPVVANVAGKFQLVMSGPASVKGYDPKTGNELWGAIGKWQLTCGTAVWHEDLVIVSGGFPEQQTLAVKADGSAEIVWENPRKLYEQSLIVVDGYLYGLADSGVCYCWDAKTGKEQWKKRVQDKVSASPVYANGNIYMTTEDGTCYVIAANPEKYELIAENKFGDRAFATPTIVDNKIYARFGVGDQEWLYCFGTN